RPRRRSSAAAGRRPRTAPCRRRASGAARAAERGELDGVEDLRVAGAAAEVAGQRLSDLLSRRPGIIGEERSRGQQEARGAVAALGRAELGEGLLERVEPAGAGQALDRRDRATLELDRQRQAGEHRPAVDKDRARAALAELTAVLRAREPHLLPQNLEQGLVGRRGEVVVLAVHAEPEESLG